MTITITPQGVAMFVVAALAVILLVYLILLLKKVIGTLQAVDALLNDAKTVTEIAARRTKDVDGMVGGLVEAAGILADGVKGNQNIAKAASGIVNATASCVGIIKDKKAEKEEK